VGELTIREVRARDAKPLLAMAEEAFATEISALGTDVRRLARWMRLMTVVYPVQKHLPKPLMVSLMGLVADQPVGNVIAEPGKEAWYIQNVMVGKDHRRRGYGGALVEAVCSRAAQAGVPRALLHMREDNVAAYGLYSSLGFQPFERVYAMLLDPQGAVQSPPLPAAYAVVPRRRYDPRMLPIRDRCQEPGAAELRGPSPMPRLLERAMGAILRPTDAERLAIVSAGQWVGIYQYVQGSPTESVSLSIAVLPEHRGRGLERSLLARAVNRAGERGAKRLVISVGASNAPLQEACQELGFATQFVGVGMARPLPPSSGPGRCLRGPRLAGDRP